MIQQIKGFSRFIFKINQGYSTQLKQSFKNLYDQLLFHQFNKLELPKLTINQIKNDQIQQIEEFRNLQMLLFEILNTNNFDNFLELIMLSLQIDQSDNIEKVKPYLNKYQILELVTLQYFFNPNYEFQINFNNYQEKNITESKYQVYLNFLTQSSQKIQNLQLDQLNYVQKLMLLKLNIYETNQLIQSLNSDIEFFDNFCLCFYIQFINYKEDQQMNNAYQQSLMNIFKFHRNQLSRFQTRKLAILACQFRFFDQQILYYIDNQISKIFQNNEKDKIFILQLAEKLQQQNVPQINNIIKQIIDQQQTIFVSIEILFRIDRYLIQETQNNQIFNQALLIYEQDLTQIDNLNQYYKFILYLIQQKKFEIVDLKAFQDLNTYQQKKVFKKIFSYRLNNIQNKSQFIVFHNQIIDIIETNQIQIEEQDYNTFLQNNNQSGFSIPKQFQNRTKNTNNIKNLSLIDIENQIKRKQNDFKDQLNEIKDRIENLSLSSEIKPALFLMNYLEMSFFQYDKQKIKKILMKNLDYLDLDQLIKINNFRMIPQKILIEKMKQFDSILPVQMYEVIMGFNIYFFEFQMIQSFELEILKNVDLFDANQLYKLLKKSDLTIFQFNKLKEIMIKRLILKQSNQEDILLILLNSANQFEINQIKNNLRIQISHKFDTQTYTELLILGEKVEIIDNSNDRFDQFQQNIILYIEKQSINLEYFQTNFIQIGKFIQKIKVHNQQNQKILISLVNIFIQHINKFSINDKIQFLSLFSMLIENIKINIQELLNIDNQISQERLRNPDILSNFFFIVSKSQFQIEQFQFLKSQIYEFTPLLHLNYKQFQLLLQGIIINPQNRTIKLLNIVENVLLKQGKFYSNNDLQDLFYLYLTHNLASSQIIDYFENKLDLL